MNVIENSCNTYYEFELMLGECDASHGFRALDYWARERLKNPNARHVAVLVAEDLSGRYKSFIETLPQFLPFIGIEIKVLKLNHPDGIATIETAIVAQPDDLIIDSGDEPGRGDSPEFTPRDRDWWEAKAGSAFFKPRWMRSQSIVTRTPARRESITRPRATSR